MIEELLGFSEQKWSRMILKIWSLEVELLEAL